LAQLGSVELKKLFRLSFLSQVMPHYTYSRSPHANLGNMAKMTKSMAKT
jgi:hypothetical protein